MQNKAAPSECFSSEDPRELADISKLIFHGRNQAEACRSYWHARSIYLHAVRRIAPVARVVASGSDSGGSYERLKNRQRLRQRPQRRVDGFCKDLSVIDSRPFGASTKHLLSCAQYALGMTSWEGLLVDKRFRDTIRIRDDQVDARMLLVSNGPG